jgi:hypothetical protein
MSEQLLSADPSAGLLSTDPNAAAPPPQGYWEDRGIGGKVWHPASGATERLREDNSLLGMPPEAAVVSGLGVGRAVAGAGADVAARAIAGAKAAVAEAAPVAKYEVAHHVLKFAGVPDGVAIPLAMYISGRTKSGKAVATEGEAAMVAPPKDMNAPHLDRSVPVSPSSLTEQQLAERLIYGKGTPPAPAELRGQSPVRPERAPAPAPVATVAAPPESVSGGIAPPAGPLPSAAPAGSQTTGPAPPATPANYPQKFLNEAAIQARRQKVTLTDADYAAVRQLTQEGKTTAEAVAQVRPTAPPTPPASTPRPRLTSAESSAYMRLRASGKTEAEAFAAIADARAFQEQFGLTTPTTAETKFPKGMRGKANPPSVPPKGVPEPSPVSTPTDYPPDFPGGYEGFRGHVNSLAEKAEARVRAGSAGSNVMAVKIGGRSYEIPQRWLQGRTRALETQGLSPKDAYQQSVQDWVDQSRMAEAAARKTTPR